VKRFARTGWLPVVIAMMAAGCEAPDPGFEPLDLTVAFDTGTARIETDADTFRLQVEIADTDSQRRVGLMRRTSLPEEAGMIFLFQQEQPADGAFYMYNTLIPLSIAFLDDQGRIGSIRDMDPCPSPYPQYCPNYEARVPFVAALEVNLGYFAERGIGVGDRVVLER
jgi:uncharacterized protein